MKKYLSGLMTIGVVALMSCTGENTVTPEVVKNEISAKQSTGGKANKKWKQGTKWNENSCPTSGGNCVGTVVVYGDRTKQIIEDLKLHIDRNTVDIFFKSDDSGHRELFDLEDYKLDDLRNGVATARIIEHGNDTYTFYFVSTADTTQGANW